MKTRALILTGLFFGIFVFSNYIIVAQEQKDGPIDNKTKLEIIDTLIGHLKESYVFEDVALKMEADLRARIKKGEYETDSGSIAFAKKLTADMQAVSSDKHLRVNYSNNPLPIRTAARVPTAEEIKNRQLAVRQMNFGFGKVERLSGNIGYIELRGFMEPVDGAKTVEAAMNFIENTEALIIDLRRNGGGDPAMVAVICSYFCDGRVHLDDLYWRAGNRTDEFWTNPDVTGSKYLDKDVYVLTSNRTFSGAEEFSYNLKNLKRATIIGETTGGGAHPGGGFRLGDHFSAFISTGRAISPITKTNWEGTGVIPDIAVSKEEALKTAHIKALESVSEKEQDPDRKESLKRLIGTMKSEAN